MEINKIYNEDCLKTMERLHDIDCVLTSPPYNTDRPGNKYGEALRYDGFNDCRSDKEYMDWTCDIFQGFDKILKPNGSVLYNLSYSSENVALMWKTINAVMERTPFTIADTIIWKKPSALPNNRTPNKLTRICEFVFVMCRKTEIGTFHCNKEVVSVVQGGTHDGQVNYKNYFNFIEAPNNDENCPIHKATFSTMLCRKLMLLYTREGDTIYDPFMGTGTTAVACHMEKRNWIGSELSAQYCEWAEHRLFRETRQLSLF